MINDGNKQRFSNCAAQGMKGTHFVDESRGVPHGLEERRVAGVPEVASVLLEGGFVQPLSS